MRVVAIIQARMGSARLPGKTLMKLGGRPLISWTVAAAKKTIGVDQVVVATSESPEDDAISAWCQEQDIRCYRGSRDDVLSRFYLAAKAEQADYILRLTADCPFLDPTICSQVISLIYREKLDYVSNVSPPTWPDGLDCESFTFNALNAAFSETSLIEDREHVTPFISRNRDRFGTRAVICPIPGLNNERWVVDWPEDLNFIRAVADRLNSDLVPSFMDILKILDAEPSLREMNMHVGRNACLGKDEKEKKIDHINNFDRSNAMLKRARQVIPLASQTFSKSYIQYPTAVSPLFVSHGAGGRVWDIDGNEYVDLVCGLLPITLGYRDADVDLAIREQLASGITFSLSTVLESEVAEELVKVIPAAEMVRFGKNGTDATSAAIRLARAYSGREHILVCGYHGWQDWFIGSTTRDKGVPAVVKNLTHKVPFNDLNAVHKVLADFPGQCAAMIIEPMSAVEPLPDYLSELKELLHSHGALLIFDEIITGFRFALGGAQDLFGVIPDLASFGKGMGNGMPISAIVGRAEIMSQMEEVFVSGTFGGETLSLAASLAVIKKMQREPVIEKLWKTGAYLADKTKRLIIENNLEQVIKLEGRDPWIILRFSNYRGDMVPGDAVRTLFMAEMLKRGVLVSSSHNICYAHNDADAQKVLCAYEGTLALIRKALNSGNFNNWLTLPYIKPIFKIRDS